MLESVKRSTRSRSMVVVVLSLVVAALLYLVFLRQGETFSVREAEQTAPAQPVGDQVYSSPRDAALAWGHGLAPDADFEVDRVVLIHADDQWVNLRVNVASKGLCRWIGVAGQAKGGRLAWSHSEGTGVDC